ncbi:MAG: PepSY-associated TM helix domain-containing protein [Bacteroidota bacterium]
MTLKKIVGKIHLWLGLASGLVVFLVSISGAIMVFEQEIRWLTGNASYQKTIDPQKSAPASPSKVFQEALAKMPEGGSYMYYFYGPQPNNVLVNWFYHPGNEEAGVPQGYQEIHQNPYTGAVIQHSLWEGGFWGWMVMFHTTLLFPYEIGHQVVGWSTLIFIVLMISGLFLWIPKNKRGYKQRFRVKWGASPKRLNYDLHNVLGFYMTWIAILIALTGIMWSFTWFQNGVYNLATGGEEMPDFEAIQSKFDENENPQTQEELLTLIDSVKSHTLSQYPEVYRYSVSFPMDSISPISVSVLTEKGKNYDRHDEYMYDRYSGALIASERWQDQNAGERIMHLNYPIHLGLIGGIPTKIVAFLASLIAASLPITGFRIWWGRKRKKKKKSEHVKLEKKLGKKVVSS